MIYTLPESVEIGGKEFAINSDFRCILDIFEVLNDPELDNRERGFLALGFFYPDFRDIPQDGYEEAIAKMFWFIRAGGDEPKKKAPKLVDWEQDFPLIIAPVNRVAGHDLRSEQHFHWWTFMGYYMEIGDCLFSNVVRIRQMKAEGKRLDKVDAAFYKANQEIIDIKTRYSDAENDLLSAWGGAKK